MGYYKIHTHGRTWSEAARICEEENAHLAIINSKEEANVLRLLLGRHRNLPDCDEEDFLWVGVHDVYTEGQYSSVFGK
jgi:hypothetical protein